jgi:hypothetical protein
VLFYITEKSNPNYSIIPGFVEKIPKQHLKFVLCQNRVYGFLPQVPPASYYSLKNPHLIFFSIFFFKTLPLLNHPKTHHYDPKQQKFKIQTNKVP